MKNKIFIFINIFIFLFNLSIVNAEEKKAATSPKEKEIKKIEDKIDEQEKKEKEIAQKKKKAEWVSKTLDFGINKDRKDALNIILVIKEDEIRQPLEKKVIKIIEKEKDFEVLNKAISVAGELKLKEASPAIEKRLNEKNKKTLNAAVYALQQLESTSSKPALIELLKRQDLKKNSNLTPALLRTLSKFEAQELGDWIIEQIKETDNDKTIRLEMIRFLGTCQIKSSIPYLLEIYNDEEQDKLMRGFAASSLAKLEAKEATDDFIKVVNQYNGYTVKQKQKYYNLYIYTITALAKLGDTQATELLIDSLKNDNVSVRLRSIKLIKEMKDKRTIDILKYKYKYDPSQKVKNAAKDALKSMGVDVEKKDDKKTSENEGKEKE